MEEAAHLGSEPQNEKKKEHFRGESERAGSRSPRNLYAYKLIIRPYEIIKDLLIIA